MISTTVRKNRKTLVFRRESTNIFAHQFGAILPVKDLFRAKNSDFAPDIWLNRSVEGCHKALRHMLHTLVSNA